MMYSRSHTPEIRAHQAGPLALAIYEATKNVMVWKDTTVGLAIPGWPKTSAARAVIEAQVRKEFEERLRKEFAEKI